MQQRNLTMKQMKNKSSLLQFRMIENNKKKRSIKFLKLNQRTLIHDQQNHPISLSSNEEIGPTVHHTVKQKRCPVYIKNRTRSVVKCYGREHSVPNLCNSS